MTPIHISSNLIHCYFIREKIVFANMKTEFVILNDQLPDIFTKFIFTKSLREPKIDYIYNKFGKYDLCAPV